MKCPACNTILEISVTAGTDVSKTKTFLDKATEPKIYAEDPYEKLPWKVSLKKPNLSTIRITEDLLADPTAAQLYDRLRQWETLKVDKVTYRLSEFRGEKYLQRWSVLLL